MICLYNLLQYKNSIELALQQVPITAILGVDYDNTLI
jgi:hypothetical protein